jgi:hypothetical protein
MKGSSVPFSSNDSPELCELLIGRSRQVISWNYRRHWLNSSALIG